VKIKVESESQESFRTDLSLDGDENKQNKEQILQPTQFSILQQKLSQIFGEDQFELEKRIKKNSIYRKFRSWRLAHLIIKIYIYSIIFLDRR